MIEKFFSGELKVQIMKYCKKLENIKSEYDVLIFMARKSICFYDALVLNGEVSKTNSETVITTSSRILNYDCKFLKEKKIAVLDDIVIKGNTLNETIKFLVNNDIKNFDVYYIASRSFENEKSILIKEYLKEPILELENNEILVLGNAITNYISASACSYNVDYPVFYMDSDEAFVEKYILENNCAVIPSCIPGNRTDMYVQNFDCERYFEQSNLQEIEDLKFKEKEIILKMRIFHRKDSKDRKIVVIPIIVLPELKGSEIREIFRFLAQTELYEMVKNPNEHKEIGNMLNVIQYILSYQLFISVFQEEKRFCFEYSINNQDYIFPKSYGGWIEACLKNCEPVPLKGIKDISTKDDFFVLSELYGHFFDFVGNRHQKDGNHKVKFIFKEVVEHCVGFCDVDISELIGNVSTLFDYAIDTGLIVPEIDLKDEFYIRAYRLSEQYELHEEEFDLIIYMYNEYQQKTQKEVMSKILTEKLLVLFFKEVIMKILNEYKGSYENGETPKNIFGITYARFGPVVSDNSEELGVSNDSYLSKRLFDDARSPYKRLYEKDKKIYVKQIADNSFVNLPKEWRTQTKTFVNRYDYFERLLEFYNVFQKTKYINTFDKFLVISAIGENQDNQLLSLAAELKIYQTKISGKKSAEDVVVALDSIIDGMVSGIWKYICYKTSEYKECCAIVATSMEGEKKKFEKYGKAIKRFREYIDTLNEIEKASVDNLKNDVYKVLNIYRSCHDSAKNSEKYQRYVNELNRTYANNEECKIVLNNLISELKAELYPYTDKLCREKDTFNQAYMDVDKLEELFSGKSNRDNRNAELRNVVKKLMDEVVYILYEILTSWNCIVELAKNKKINIEICNTDRNTNYLKTIKEILDKNSESKGRIRAIDISKQGLENIILRLQELEHEIDILLFCINQYIMSNNSKFIPIQSFYVVKRDDGDEIELAEITEAKNREVQLNKYFDFLDCKNLAAFVKSKQSSKIIENLSEFSGYTLLDYECKRGCNTIVKTAKGCYSKRVKNNIMMLLDEYSNKVITIKDGR